MLKEAYRPRKITFLWVRGEHPPNFDSPLVFLVLGIRGAGKSAFLEVIADHYLARGHNVIDLFGARSGEGLAWLRSPYRDEKILLIKSSHVDVSCSWTTKNWESITLRDLENNRIVISSSPLYSRIDEEFVAVNHILDVLFSRLGWHKYIFLLVRESANLFYSRMKLRDTQHLAKAEAAYLIRESRHHGIAIGMDTQKLTAVDADLRNLTDYIIFKSQGYYNLPKDLWFIYRYLDPIWFRNMHPREFAVLSRTGAIGIGYFEYPYWHKEAKENLLKLLDIRVEKSEEAAELNEELIDIEEGRPIHPHI